MRPLPYLVLLITLTFASDHDTSHDIKNEHKNGQEEEDCAKAQAIAPANMHFAVNLYKHIASKSGSSAQNIFFSPVSISTAFAMLSIGAKSATHRQIIEGLSLNQTQIEEEKIHKAFEHLLLALNKPKSELQVSIGNALFVGDKVRILKSFAHEVEHHYHAAVISANFENPEDAGKQINDYVKNRTNGKIEELVRDLDEDTKMVLVNYVFFKGEWEHPFHPDSTRISNFSVDEHTEVEVPMMNHLGLYKIFLDLELGCEVIRLPYKNNTFMLLAIPELGKMHTLEEALSIETIIRWKNSTQTRLVELYLPKFSFSYSLKLNEILGDIGMTDVFSDQADFSGITEDFKLKVSKAVHKAVLDVDEKGTEAAGATAIEMVPMALFPSHRVDRPFLLLICSQETNSILFMGRVVNPTEK